MKNNFKEVLERVGEWQKTKQISLTKESIASKISEAVLINEITASQGEMLNQNMDDVHVLIAGLEMADIFKKVQLLKTSAEVSPQEIDILVYGLNQLTDVIANSGDKSLIMIQKLLSDFLEKTKQSLQTSSHDQGDYEHAEHGKDGVTDKNLEEPKKPESPTKDGKDTQPASNGDSGSGSGA